MSSSESDKNAFPVVGWNIGYLPDKQVIVFNPQYIWGDNDTPEKPQEGRYYGLTPAIAFKLWEDLGKQLDKCANDLTGQISEA